MLRPSPRIVALLIALAAPAARAAFEGDITPRLQNGILISDGESDLDGSAATDVGVFQYTLGELAPGYTQDPGIQPLPTSNLPPNSFLGFNIRGPLQYWNGTGAPTLTTATGAEQLELYFGTNAVFISGASPAQNGFVLQQLSASGAGHRHLNAQLLGSPSPTGPLNDSLGNTYTAAPNGIYAIPLQITDSTAQTTTPATYISYYVWAVYNQGLSDAQLTAAADALIIPGDANLDRNVDVSDLGILATNYGQPLTGRSFGDFNNDGIVNVSDLGLLATNYGTGTSNQPLSFDSAQLPFTNYQSQPAPEPTSLSLLSLAALLVLRRRPLPHKN